MFERLCEKYGIYGIKQPVNGPSEAMAIVDKYMRSDVSPEELDRAYGYAYTEIRKAYISGRITSGEKDAALTTLDNQYSKLRPKAVIKTLFT